MRGCASRAHIGDACGPAAEALREARPQRALLRLARELEHRALDLGRFEVGALFQAVEAREKLFCLGVAVLVAAAQVLAQRGGVVCGARHRSGQAVRAARRRVAMCASRPRSAKVYGQHTCCSTPRARSV